ncbi:MAG: hypothetical protein R6W76_18365, partial [Caldilinea sp.]
MLKIVQRVSIPVTLVLAAVTISGCGVLFGGGSQEPTPTPAVVRPIVPTFTPTPVTEAPAPRPEPVEAARTLVIAIDLEAAPAVESATEVAAEEVEPTATPA